LEFLETFFIKVPSFKCHVHLSSGSRTNTCRQADRETYGQTTWHHFSWRERYYGYL